jgi:hypothetical protein
MGSDRDAGTPTPGAQERVLKDWDRLEPESLRPAFSSRLVSQDDR